MGGDKKSQKWSRQYILSYNERFISLTGRWLGEKRTWEGTPKKPRSDEGSVGEE